MTDNNSNSSKPISNSPESNFTNHNVPFDELSDEFFMFDDHEWLEVEDDPPDHSFISGPLPNQHFYQSNQVSGVLGGTAANSFEGSSSSKPISQQHRIDQIVILFCVSSLWTYDIYWNCFILLVSFLF